MDAATICPSPTQSDRTNNSETVALPRRILGTPWGVRTQLLLSVNSALAILLVGILVVDSWREMTFQFNERQILLTEEAGAIAIAVTQLSSQGDATIQQYIDNVCARMNETHSPWHHIVVETQNAVIQATSHARQSPEMYAAIQRAEPPDFRSTLGDVELIVGRASMPSGSISIAESAHDIRSHVWSTLSRRAIALTILGLVAAAIVNLVVGHVITRPLSRLVTTVRRIESGDYGVQSRTFRSAELCILADEVNTMSRSLARVEADRKIALRKAREIQRNLLPASVTIPGVRYATIFDPAEDVGGDFFDVIRLVDGSHLFCVADVSGHGIPAAMTATLLKALITEASEKYDSPAGVIESMNRRLTQINPTGVFVTMAILHISADGERLQFASAGHEPTLMQMLSGEIRAAPSTGPIVGLFPTATWDDVTYEIDGVRKVVIATDGVSETFDKDDVMFGRDRLCDTLREAQFLDEESTCDLVREHLASFREERPSGDDVTLLVVGVTGDANQVEGD